MMIRIGCLSLAILCLAGAQVRGDGPLTIDPVLQAAESERIAAIAKAKPSAVSVFVPGGAGGGSGDPCGWQPPGKRLRELRHDLSGSATRGFPLSRWWEALPTYRCPERLPGFIAHRDHLGPAEPMYRAGDRRRPPSRRHSPAPAR